MGNFKNFMENYGHVGLGNLGGKINQLYHSNEFGNQIHGAYVSTDVSGSEQSNTKSYGGHPLHLPSTDLGLPSTEKTGRIVMLRAKKNPIYVRLSDGTEANFTWDEYNRIEGGQPAIGKVMTLIFQRSPQDTSRMYSKIEKAIVRG